MKIMKLQRSFFILIILFALFQIGFGQDESKAEIIDEFGRISCDDFLARIDNFYIALDNNPNSQGYIVIYGDNDYLRTKLVYELWFNGAAKFGAVKSENFSDNRITKIRGEEKGNIKIQLWKVPDGAKKPDFNEEKWNFVFPSNTKPFIFYEEFWDQICSSVSFEKIYIEYLNANPEAHGNIVIYEESYKNFLKTKKETLNLLFKIPAKKFRFFFVKSESSNIEFWLIP